ncbi:MAG: hypothetical protein OSA84_07815 [Akkermansiaceae bacterium]|nr:hypothetical protein [Akkermansiaceae bacterium]
MGVPSARTRAATRQDRPAESWKFVESRGKDEAVQLFNLSKDIAEENPAENPGIQKELKKALNAWKASWADIPQRS